MAVFIISFFRHSPVFSCHSRPDRESIVSFFPLFFFVISTPSVMPNPSFVMPDPLVMPSVSEVSLPFLSAKEEIPHRYCSILFSLLASLHINYSSFLVLMPLQILKLLQYGF
jgi:hypothetical protein